MNAPAPTVPLWDCHAHLFGPYERFPLAPERSYTPPEAIEPQYLALLRRLGLDHGVLVHPSACGDDHSLLLHALAAQPSLRCKRSVDTGDLRPSMTTEVTAAVDDHRGHGSSLAVPHCRDDAC